MTKIEHLRERHPEIQTFHQDNALVGVLLEQRNDLFRPTIDREEQAHCLLSRPSNFSVQAVKFTDICEPFPPPALDKVMPAFQFERSVDLFSAIVAKDERITVIPCATKRRFNTS